MHEIKKNYYSNNNVKKVTMKTILYFCFIHAKILIRPSLFIVILFVNYFYCLEVGISELAKTNISIQNMSILHNLYLIVL